MLFGGLVLVNLASLAPLFHSPSSIIFPLVIINGGAQMGQYALFNFVGFILWDTLGWKYKSICG